MKCSNCEAETPELTALDEWFDLYERAQADPKSTTPEQLNEAFTRLRYEIEKGRE